MLITIITDDTTAVAECLENGTDSVYVCNAKSVIDDEKDIAQLAAVTSKIGNVFAVLRANRNGESPYLRWNEVSDQVFKVLDGVVTATKNRDDSLEAAMLSATAIKLAALSNV